MSAQQQAAWPEGVIARYLTVGGAALADPSAVVDVIDNGEDSYPMWRFRMECRVCPEEIGDSDEYLIRGRAQAHADRCRALPKPEVSR